MAKFEPFILIIVFIVTFIIMRIVFPYFMKEK